MVSTRENYPSYLSSSSTNRLACAHDYHKSVLQLLSYLVVLIRLGTQPFMEELLTHPKSG